MIDRSKISGEYGRSYSVVLGITACFFLASAVTTGLTVRTLSAATPGIAAEPAATGEAHFVYFPAQYVNQATEFEPLPPTI